MSKSLPILDCANCGVCCRHMGYPAFNFPRDEQVLGTKVPLEDSGPVRLALEANITTEDHDRRRWNEMPDPLRSELATYISNYVPPLIGLDGPCFWFDSGTRRCKHHEHRPQVCRDFQVGSDACLDWRKAYRVDVNTD